jgi:hypothetical protein
MSFAPKTFTTGMPMRAARTRLGMQLLITPRRRPRVLPTGDRSRVFRPPRFFQSGCPSFTVNDVNGGITHVNAHCSCPRGPGGCPKLQHIDIADRRSAFVPKIPKLKRRRPLLRGGGFKSSTGGSLRDRPGPHAEIFFLEPEVLGIQTAIKEIKGRVISRANGAVRSSAAPFIFSCRCRGGDQISGDFDVGPAGQSRIFRRKIGETIFCCERGPTIGRWPAGKAPRNSGGGGSVRPRVK